MLLPLAAKGYRGPPKAADPIRFLHPLAHIPGRVPTPFEPTSPASRRSLRGVTIVN